MKVSLAVAALLAIGTEASRIKQSIAENLSSHKFADELLQYSPTSCHAAIDRISDNTNTVTAYNTCGGDCGGRLWTDPSFPPEASSIIWAGYGSGSGGDDGKSVNIPSNLKWQRLSEIYSPALLWGDLGKAVPNGIAQGSLGDCWFLASAAAVAEESWRIKKLFPAQDFHGWPFDGMFRVKFWLKNQWVGINVDDYVPMHKSIKNRPFAAQKSTNNALWVPVLEKAFSKLMGNYDRIAGGFGMEGLHFLTGKPTFMMDTGMQNKATLKPAQQYFAKNNYPMTSGCCRNGGVDGLVNGHLYSLLDVKTVKGVDLAKMRNPWNAESYHGAYSDSDPFWQNNPGAAKEVGFVKADDGIFWMPYDTYIKYFDTFTVAIDEKFKGHKVHDVTLKKRDNQFKIYNPRDQLVYISGDMYSHRHYPRASKCKPKSGNTWFMLLDKNFKQVGDYAWISRQWGFGVIGSVTEPLPKGEYTVYMVNQDTSYAQPVSVNIYAKEQRIQWKG